MVLMNILFLHLFKVLMLEILKYMVEEVYKEEDFYQDEGGPTESFFYCCYVFYTGKKTDYGPDYDQFVLVENAEYRKHAGKYDC